MEEKVLEVLREVVYEVTGIDNLTMDTEFVNALAFNSMDLANMVCAFEARCDKEIDIRDVKNMVQVKDVVRYIMDHGLMEEKD